MKDKRWILGLIVLIVAVVALGVWGYKKDGGSGAVGPQIAGSVDLENQSYYDENANVMEFFQDSCSWCVKEHEVLVVLGAQGYRIKPMNIGANHPDNQKWWTDYKISGTPTFVAKNGDRLEGYQTEDALKTFLDNHKN